MNESIKKDEKGNKKEYKSMNFLVPILINDSYKLEKEMKTRIKLNSIFSNFEAKSYNQLKYFISESKNRYQNSKSVLNYNPLHSNSRRNCLRAAKEILSDDFYLNADIFNENEKMKKKTTVKLHKNIQDTIVKIHGMNDMTSKPINKPKKINTSQNFKSLSKNDKLKKLQQDKLEIKKLLTEDNEKINKSIFNYYRNFNKLSQLAKEKQGNSSSNDRLSKKLITKVPKIKLLNYKKYIPPPKLQQEDLDKLNKVDVIKLFPYYKINQIKQKEKYKTPKKSTDFNFLTETNINKNYTVFNNTRGTVLNHANKEMGITSSFNKKREDLEKLLGVDDIPKLSEYEKIIKSKYQKLKDDRHKKYQKLYESQKFLGLSHTEKINRLIDYKLQLLDDFSSKIYRNTRQKQS